MRTVWLLLTSLCLVACGGYLGTGPAPAVHAPAPPPDGGRWRLAIDLAGDETEDVRNALEWVLRDNQSIERVSAGAHAQVRITGGQSRDVGYCSWRAEVLATHPTGQPLLRDVKEYEKGGIWSNVEAECEKMITQSIVWSLESVVARLAQGGAAGPPAAPPGEPVVSAALAPRPGATKRTTALALVIGVERYRRDLPPATGAAADARLFADHAEVALGIPRRNIRLLLDADATKSSIDAELDEWLPKNARRSGDVFFFFAGHGAPDPTGGKTYLVPWDADPKFIKKQGVAVDRVYAALGALPTTSAFAFVDACFSGAGGRSVLAPGTRPLVREKAANIRSARLGVLSAAGPDQITGAAPGGNGLFSHYLLRGLNGEADESGDGVVTLAELAEFTRTRVADDARRENRDQTPILLGARRLGATSLVTR